MRPLPLMNILICPDLSKASRIGSDGNGNILCEFHFNKHKLILSRRKGDELDESEMDEKSVKKEFEECKDIKDESDMKGRAVIKDEDEDEARDEDPKAKRKRGPKTTIQPNQLTILRTCFDKNPKPSPKIFEELSKDTGLTKRVIQVK